MMEDSCCWFCWDLGMVVEGKGELVGCFEVKSGTTQFGNWKWTVYISIPTPQLMYNQGGVPDKTPYIFTVVPFCLLGKGGHTFLREFGTGVPLFIHLSWQ